MALNAWISVVLCIYANVTNGDSASQSDFLDSYPARVNDADEPNGPQEVVSPTLCSSFGLWDRVSVPLTAWLGMHSSPVGRLFKKT